MIVFHCLFFMTSLSAVIVVLVIVFAIILVIILVKRYEPGRKVLHCVGYQSLKLMCTDRVRVRVIYDNYNKYLLCFCWLSILRYILYLPNHW